MINTILNNLKNKNSINLGKTTNSKNCLIIHTSDYLANVLNMRIILAINGKSGQRQNYGNDKIVTFFLECFQSCFIPFILPCLQPPHLANAYAGLIPIPQSFLNQGKTHSSILCELPSWNSPFWNIIISIDHHIKKQIFKQVIFQSLEDRV